MSRHFKWTIGECEKFRREAVEAWREHGQNISGNWWAEPDRKAGRVKRVARTADASTSPCSQALPRKNFGIMMGACKKRGFYFEENSEDFYTVFRHGQSRGGQPLVAGDFETVIGWLDKQPIQAAAA